MSEDCLFCRIVAGEIPSSSAGGNDLAYAFHDIAPQAPVHVLVVPRRHVASVNDLDEGDHDEIGAIHALIRDVVAHEGIRDTGYRVVVNVGRDGQQTVDHLHYHVLGGRRLAWPPG